MASVLKFEESRMKFNDVTVHTNDTFHTSAVTVHIKIHHINAFFNILTDCDSGGCGVEKGSPGDKEGSI